MVKRKHHTVRGKRGYKKCLISKMKRTKFSSPKQAARAFKAARKKCHALLTKKPRTTRRRGRKKRRAGRRRRRMGAVRRPRMSPWARRQIGVMPGEFGAFMAQRRPRR